MKREEVYVLIHRRFYKSTEWWNIDSTDEQFLNLPLDERPDIKLYNDAGGYNYLLSTDEIKEILHTNDKNEIFSLENRKKTSAYQNFKKQSTNKSLIGGWLAPDGKMYYCEYHDHVDFASTFIGIDSKTLETRGWVHILKSGKRAYPHIIDKITHEQAYTLRNELNCYVDEDNITERN